MVQAQKSDNQLFKRRVTPIIECVDAMPAGKLTAHFGYKNNTTQIQNIPVGLLNFFFPSPANRGQPIKFQLGTKTNVFTVQFPANSLIVWSLDGRIAIAHKNIKRCQVTPTPDAGADMPAPMCPASCNDNNPCTSDRCDMATGQCVNTVVVGQACSDGNVCNGAETCNAQGACGGGTSLNCDDNNVCTADSCSATGGCGHAPGNENGACTVGGGAGTCKAGVCTPMVVNCDDNNPCTIDAQTPAGGCTHTAGNEGVACADTNACNGAEVCRMGACVAPAPLNCEDNNPCTIDTCNAATGCAHAPQSAGFVCAPATGCSGASTCVGTVCTAGPGGSCDDQNPCTADSCGANGVCGHAPLDNVACGDGNPCNGSEMCRAGTCAAGLPVVCTASDQCHDVGICNPTTGACSNPAKPDQAACSDGNSCTEGDVCRSGSCAAGTPKTCTASDQCHDVGTCNTTTGACSNPVAVGKACNDGNMCTNGDVCAASGTCAGTGTCGPTPCEICQRDNCPADIAGCGDFTGQDRIDCEALLACTERTNCADSGDGQSCYCGTADIGACLGTGANGECKAEVEVAGKSTNGQTLAERFVDPVYPVGRVFNLYGCRVALCSDVCQ